MAGRPYQPSATCPDGRGTDTSAIEPADVPPDHQGMALAGAWRARAVGCRRGCLHPAQHAALPVMGHARSLSSDCPGVGARSDGEAASMMNIWEVVATQVGPARKPKRCRTSRRRPQPRQPQGLRRRNRAELGERVKAAADTVQDNLNVIPPRDGTLIRFNYVSPDREIATQVAAGVATAFINLTLQRRYEASAYARNFLRAADCQDPGGPRAVRAPARRLCAGPGDHQHRHPCRRKQRRRHRFAVG